MNSKLKSSLVALAMILVGLATVFTTSADAKTICYKQGYQVAIREHPWSTSKSMGTVPAMVTVAKVRPDGWAEYEEGWIFTRWPNVQPCGTTTTAPKSSKSLPPEPKSSGFRLPTIPSPKPVFRFLVPLVRDLATAGRAEAQLPFVKFCMKHRSNFGWNKCFIDADKAEVFVARLKNLNTNADARKDARSKLKNMLQANPLGQTQVRLDKVIDQDLTGVSAGRWNSKRVKGLESLAERLADSQRVSDFEKFISKTHPKLKEASAFLKQQHPVFTTVATQYRPLLEGPKQTEQEKALTGKGKDALLFEENAVFMIRAPLVRFNKRMNNIESALPMNQAKFNSEIASFSAIAHDSVFESLKTGSEMTAMEYAKDRGLTKYVEDYINLQKQVTGNDPNPVNPCNLRKGKDAKNCLEAVGVLTQFENVVKPATATVFEVFRAKSISSTKEELTSYVIESREIFGDKIQELTTPKSGWLKTASSFVSANLFYFAGGFILLVILVFSRPRRRYSVTSLGSGRF